MALAPLKETGSVTLALPSQGTVAPPRSTELRLIDAVPLFLSLSEEEKQALAQSMARRTCRKGDVLAEAGKKLTSLMVIRSGVVAVSRLDGIGETETEVSRLSPGDYSGESGLFTGSGETGTLRALTAVVIYEVGQAGLPH